MKIKSLYSENGDEFCFFEKAWKSSFNFLNLCNVEKK